jgi:hypothetical protein
LPTAAKKGPGLFVPLAIAGAVGGAYYFYAQGERKPVSAATLAPGNPVLTNPAEWIDFKVSFPLAQYLPLRAHRRFVTCE